MATDGAGTSMGAERAALAFISISMGGPPQELENFTVPGLGSPGPRPTPGHSR